MKIRGYEHWNWNSFFAVLLGPARVVDEDSSVETVLFRAGHETTFQLLWKTNFKITWVVEVIWNGWFFQTTCEQKGSSGCLNG